MEPEISWVEYNFSVIRFECVTAGDSMRRSKEYAMSYDREELKLKITSTALTYEEWCPWLQKLKLEVREISIQPETVAPHPFIRA